MQAQTQGLSQFGECGFAGAFGCFGLCAGRWAYAHAGRHIGLSQAQEFTPGFGWRHRIVKHAVDARSNAGRL